LLCLFRHTVTPC